MFGLKKHKEKKQLKRDLKQEKRDNKSLEELAKNRNKIEAKVIKNISKKLDKDENIIGIVAYSSYLSYIVKTDKNRFFVGGVQGFKTIETILTKDKILNVTKTGLMPTYINLELINGAIRLFGEGNIAKSDKLYMDVVNLVN